MPLKPHPTDPDKMIFDNKDRIALIEKLGRQEGVCARCGGIVYDPMIPQRSWQGLTDEEIKTAWSQLWYDLGNGKFAASDDPSRHTTVMFARAIESKIQEKNGL